VITEVEEIKSKVFGTSTVFTHSADQLHTRLLRPMNILDALEFGLLGKLGGSWAWCEDVYERLAKAGQDASDGVGCP
jgi:hypothetical protein